MRSAQRTLILTLVAAFTLSLAVQDAEAKRRWWQFGRAKQGQQSAQTFQGFAQKHGMKSAMHGGKLYIKVDTKKLNKHMKEYAQIGNGKVLEFAGTGHLHTRFNGKKDANFLSGLSIGTFSPPSTYTGKRVTVVVKLNDKEHRELDAYISAASKNYSGASKEIGKFNYNGGMPNRYYPNANPMANCTSWISAAKLDGRQSLGSTCGVGSAASPRSWIRSLAQRGNSRVEAVLLHNFDGDVSNARAVQQFVTDATTKKH